MPASFATPGTAPTSTVGHKPITSVGIGTSSVPYGAFGTYVNSNTGVWGFAGPSADALQRPTTWYVRAGGSNTNGGSSSGTSAERTGTDGVTSGTTFTSATGNFTSADVGKGIFISFGSAQARIVSVTNATTVTLNVAPGNTSGITWNLGGAWATFANGFQSVSPIRSGDTVYIGAGTYRAVTTINNTPAFNGTVSVVGDVDGTKTGDAGMVQLTAYTTNDKTAPTATTLINLNGKSNLSWSRIMFVAGGGTMVTGTTTNSQNITFQDCAFLAGGAALSQLGFNVTAAYGVPLNWLIDRCRFFWGRGAPVQFVMTRGALDYDVNAVIQNTMFILGAATTINIGNTGAGAAAGGGVRVRNVFNLNAGSFINPNTTPLSTIFPCSVYGSFLYGASGSAVLNAAAAGQIIEDYNLIYSSSPRTNAAVGAHSISDGSYAPLFHFGQETQWGGLLRMIGEPMAGSPMLGFGSPYPTDTNPVDLRGFPRPAGLGAAGSQLGAAGPLERANTSVQATSPAPPSGTNVWKFVGPAYQDFLLPVDTTSTTIACTVQRDSNYSGPLPVLELLANPTLGVTAQSVADTGSSGANNTLTLAAFTATAVGAVTVRIRSRDLTGASVVAFSVFTVT